MSYGNYMGFGGLDPRRPLARVRGTIVKTPSGKEVVVSPSATGGEKVPGGTSIGPGVTLANPTTSPGKDKTDIESTEPQPDPTVPAAGCPEGWTQGADGGCTMTGATELPPGILTGSLFPTGGQLLAGSILGIPVKYWLVGGAAGLAFWAWKKWGRKANPSKRRSAKKKRAPRHGPRSVCSWCRAGWIHSPMQGYPDAHTMGPALGGPLPLD